MPTGGIYNPASLRVKEASGGNNTPGVVTLVFDDGSVIPQGAGQVRVNLGGAVALSLSRATLTGTQDGVNDTFTIPGTDTWSLVWLLRDGVFVATTDYSAGGTGNRTLTLTMAALPDATAPAGAELLEVIGAIS